MKILSRLLMCFSFMILFSHLTADLSGAISRIPANIVSLSSGYVIVVDKKEQKLYVFQREDAQIEKVFEAVCSTGKNRGPKVAPGDAKTPEGIFFVNQILKNTQPNETYGSIAYALDYPNVMDRKAGRGGNNIWIHGTTRPLVPFQSNGCVVLKDADAKKLEEFIQIQKTPVIITAAVRWVSPEQTVAEKRELQGFLSAWQKAVLSGDPQIIDLLYLPGTQPQNKGREELLQISRKVGKMSRYYLLEPRDVTFLQNGPQAVIIFDQVTEIQKDNTFRGAYQRLVLERVQNQWYAVAEVPKGPVVASAQTSAPATAVEAPPAEKLVPISNKREEENVKSFVLKWAKYWEEGKFGNYKLCYSENFRSRGMNREAWVKYKERVRANSGKISIRIENLKVSVSDGGRRATAVFVQDYKSSILKNKTKKKLDLIRVGNDWKIERETVA
ncbi:MAG TPA: L,D-transpeptidase [Syntrophales bacterium]|nr:L,D-transpeptidase [Syntrophales bacterium]HOL60113.1 L,D-transpeptidase [Syntrophales bacterium]HPO36194.1 L,D-transpeptidase [Syntrophales bacterium]